MNDKIILSMSVDPDFSDPTAIVYIILYYIILYYIILYYIILYYIILYYIILYYIKKGLILLTHVLTYCMHTHTYSHLWW